MGNTSSTPKRHRLAGPVGGVNTRDAETLLDDGEYTILRNLELVEDVGIFSMRRGTKALNSSAMSGSYPVRGGIRWYYGTTPTAETVFGHNTFLYKNPASPTSIGSGFTANKEWFFSQYEDYLFCHNGTDAMQRWDGTTMRAAGFVAPSTNLAGAAGAAGALTGTYKYKYTFVYDSVNAHESSASAVSSNVVLTAQRASLSSIDTGGTGCTDRAIYRTKAGGSLFYFVARIGNNTDTTYTDNTADTALGSDQAPTDNGIPPVGQFSIMFKGRFFVARGATSNKARLWFQAIASTERNPQGTLSLHGKDTEIFPSDHWIDIGDDNVPITGLAVWGDNLVIFKSNEIYMLRGTDASNMSVWSTGNSVGCIAPRSIVNMGGEFGIMFLGKGNTTPTVYSFKGGTAIAVSDDQEKTFRANVVGLGSAYTVKPSAGRYRDQYILSYAYDSTPNYEIAKFDTRMKRWSYDRGPAPSCWIPYVGVEDSGEMVFGHAVAGWLVQWDKQGGDFDPNQSGAPNSMQMDVETGWLDLGAPDQMKQIKEIRVVAEAHESAAISIERRYNFRTDGNVTGAPDQVMASSIEGANVFSWRVQAEMEGGSDEPECGYHMKLILTVNVPYQSSSDPFLPVKIHSITVYYYELPPVDHEQ